MMSHRRILLRGVLRLLARKATRTADDTEPSKQNEEAGRTRSPTALATVTLWRHARGRWSVSESAAAAILRVTSTQMMHTDRPSQPGAPRTAATHSCARTSSMHGAQNAWAQTSTASQRRSMHTEHSVVSPAPPCLTAPAVLDSVTRGRW
jgi:hypothetical protein